MSGRRSCAALFAAGATAGYTLERGLARRLLPPHDPAAMEVFEPPPDCERRNVPTDDGGELHVLDRGQGQPIVFFHGVTLSTVAWHYQLVDLSERFRVLAVDHRGHGLSTAGHEPWGMERLAKDVAQLLEALDLRDAVVVGHSMGGMAVLRFALDFPDVCAERVTGLVLVSTAAGPLRRLVGWKALTRLVTVPARLGLVAAGRVPGGLFASNDLSQLLFRVGGHGVGAKPEHVELNRAMTAGTSVAVLAELMGAILLFDVRDRLAELDLPVLVLAGSRDLVTPLAAARTLADGLPRAELAVLDGAGHMSMLDQPEEVTKLIERFAEGVR